MTKPSTASLINCTAVGNKRMNRPIIIIVALVSAALLTAGSVLAFVEPTAPPPGGQISRPLLSGDQAQTRQGPLHISGNVSVSGNLSAQSLTTTGSAAVANANNDALLCLGSSGCITSWSNLVGDLVRLFDPGQAEYDVGNVNLRGSLAVQAEDQSYYGVFAGAAAPVSDPTYGLSGTSHDGSVDDPFKSYGVLGKARHDSINPGRLAYGVFASNNGNPSAYAARFYGRVEITDEVGSFLCLPGPAGGSSLDCRTEWPNPASTDGLLKLQTVQPAAAQSGRVAVSGRAWFQVAALGDPAGYTPAESCGDGVCNEDPAVCPVDCPTLSSITTVWQSMTDVLINWQSDVPMNSIVVYGLTEPYGAISRDDTEVTSHSLLVTGLVPGTPYLYKVGGLTESNAVRFSDEQTLSGSLDVWPPNQPTNIQAAVHLPPPDESVSLTWSHPLTDNPAAGASGFKEFKIIRWLQGGPPEAQIGTTTQKSYTDSDPALAQQSTYLYKVIATDNAGNESPSTGVFVNIPKPCTSDIQCIGVPGNPYCCNWSGGGKTCQSQACGGKPPPPVE